MTDKGSPGGSLARTATWLAAGRGIVALVALALPIVLARTLSQNDYGLYKQVDLAGALLLPFLLVGFDKSITFFVPRRDKDPAAEITTPIVSLLAIASAVLAFALLAPDTFGRLLGTAPIPLLAAAAATYAIASAVHVAAARALVAVGQAKTAAVLPVIVGVPRTITLVAVVLVDPSLTSILWVILLFGGLDFCAWLGVLVARGCLRVAFDRVLLRRHLRYGGTLAIGSMVHAWGLQLDNYLVASTLSPAMFATYRIGRLRVPFLPIFSKALIDATAPRYSRLESEQRYREMAGLWKLSSEVLLPIGILLSAALASTAHWSVPFVYPDYEASVPIFRVFAFAILLESLAGIEQVLRALAALRFLLVSTIVALVVRIGLGLLVLQQGPLWLLTLTQLSISLGLFLARLVYIRTRLGVAWGDVVPIAALTGTLPLVALGLAGTWAIDRWVAGADWVLLLAVAPIWGALLVWLVWRRGLLHRLIPGRLIARLRP